MLTRIDATGARWQLRDAVLLKINNLLSRVAIGNEFSSLMFATTGGFVRFNKLLVERLFDLLFGSN